MLEAVEPVGMDSDVHKAMLALEKAMAAAARRQGMELQTVVLLWASAKDGDAYGGSLVKGDTSVKVMEFLNEILQDDSGDTARSGVLGRPN